MKRFERANLCSKVYMELMDSIKFNDVLKTHKKQLKQKKKKTLFTNKSINNSVTSIKDSIGYKGLKINIITNQNGFDVVINSSPIDAGFVEYIRVIPNGNTVLYTQHLLDRYNERVYDRMFTKHSDIINELIFKNPIKASMSFDDDNNIVQRINEGFLLGGMNTDKKNVVFNTFYDSEEYKDNFHKGFSRDTHTTKSKLSNEEIREFDRLQHQYYTGKISLEDYDYQVKSNGYM